MVAATPEPDEEAEFASPGEWRRSSADEGSTSAVEPDEWRSALSARIAEVRASEAEAEQLRKGLAHIKHAFVLVFDVDTEDEAVYIMDVEQQRGVVLAFETEGDAEEYARSLEALDMDNARVVHGSSETSVQALDLEVLVVSSREANFRVAMVFDGDLSFSSSSSGSAADELGVFELDGAGLPFTGEAGLLFTETASGDKDEAAEYVTIAVSMVPEDMYAGRSSADFIDPEVDEMFVLVHDTGTADAQYFSIALNQSECVACFKTEGVALTNPNPNPNPNPDPDPNPNPNPNPNQVWLSASAAPCWQAARRCRCRAPSCSTSCARTWARLNRAARCASSTRSQSCSPRTAPKASTALPTVPVLSTAAAARFRRASSSPMSLARWWAAWRATASAQAVAR